MITTKNYYKINAKTRGVIPEMVSVLQLSQSKWEGQESAEEYQRWERLEYRSKKEWIQGSGMLHSIDVDDKAGRVLIKLQLTKDFRKIKSLI